MEFLDGNWDSLCKMLTFEDQDTTLPFNHEFVDNQQSSAFLNNFCDDFLTKQVYDVENSYLDIDSLINEPDHMVEETTLTKKKPRVSKNRGKKRGRAEEDEEEECRTNAPDSESTVAKAVNEDGKPKKRASRGAATDPQSLYARRRRQRINERLRILQNLVPNGNKVDISTMLEEAVNYVKFMQLQIKLLSSDDLWMYAPVAYNGVDIDHYRRISPFQIL